MKSTILVTGYGGFLGQSVCRWLSKNGYRVRGIARNLYPNMVEIGVEPLVGDLGNRSKLEQACHGIDGIIHTAAIAGVWGPRQLYEAINFQATADLVEVARKAGVRALVYSSSPSVTFDGNPQSGIDESIGYPNRWLCDYPRTKAAAEKLVLSVDPSDRMMTCSLRPHLIWGQGDPHLIPRLISRCRQGRLRRVGSGKNRIDTVHVAEAAHAHGLALERLLDRDPQVIGQKYFITDGQPIECWDWISQILEGSGLKPPEKSISLTSAYAIGAALEVLYRWTRRIQEPPMTRFLALQLGVDHYFNIEKARRELGYLPTVDRSEAFHQMKPWLTSVASQG